jgi:hypothetical protein
MAVNPNWTTSFGSPVAMDGFAVTPADADLAVPARGLYVGGAGDVVIMTPLGTTLTLVGVVAGSILPIAAKQVRAATTATNIVGLL